MRGGRIYDSSSCDSRMSIVAYILCAGGLGHAIELSCLGLLCNREVEGGGTKTLRLCHMCASITRTISIAHTLTPDSHACGKHIKVVFLIGG